VNDGTILQRRWSGPAFTADRADGARL
jgi:hypothetical protein